MTERIEVWRIRPLRRVGGAASLRAILRPEEIARADRKVDEGRRHTWITSRAVLRLLLAHYTHIPANELRFVAGKNGKPHLDNSQNQQGITFNFSHSVDMALLAVSWNRQVGVDVEHVREMGRSSEIAARRLSSAASAELQKASEGDKSRIFLQNWARYEALLKARAGTIWNPDGDMQQGTPSSFSVRDLDTGSDYVGALAAQGDGWSVEVRDYGE